MTQKGREHSLLGEDQSGIIKEVVGICAAQEHYPIQTIKQVSWCNIDMNWAS